MAKKRSAGFARDADWIVRSPSVAFRAGECGEMPLACEISFAPLGLFRNGAVFPWLTPWAVFLSLLTELVTRRDEFPARHASRPRNAA